MSDFLVKELMVPLSEYAAVLEGSTLFDAVLALEKAQEEFDHTKYKHRGVLILDKNKRVISIGYNGPTEGDYHCIHVCCAKVDGDPKTGKLKSSTSAYEHPQPHACFIQSVADDLVNEGGIMDLWVREARLFKYGSGTGTNFSSLRAEGEKLSGGGKSSGLMGFLKIGDRAAGAIKSGGTTRRAAKMVIVDIDHPDIEEFIDWKVVEEQKVAALVAGSGPSVRSDD